MHLKSNKKTRLRKITTYWLIVFVLFSSMGSGFVYPLSAHAEYEFGSTLNFGIGQSGAGLQTVGKARDPIFRTINLTQSVQSAPGFPVADVGTRIFNFIKSMAGMFRARLEQTLDVAFKQAVRGFVQRGAYTLAVKLASGGSGQTPLIVKQWNLGDELDAAVGGFLNDTVGKAWGKDLCEPLDPIIKVNIELSARQILAPSKPSCTFRKIQKNFKKLKNVKLIDFPKTSQIFNPSGNDLGAVLTITSGALRAGAEAEQKERDRRNAEGGVRSIVDPVTGQVRTPSFLVKSYGEKLLVDNPSDVEFMHSDNPFANAIDIFIGTFINTFASNLMTKLFKEGVNPDLAIRGADFGSSSGIEAAELKFADLIPVDFRSGNSIDIVAELESCEQSSDIQKSANNCVIDRKFAAAITNRNTVGQAIEQGNLQGDWAIGQDEVGNGAFSDLRDTPGKLYSLRSISILRKYGILPVGWEIAARYITEVDSSNKRWTLDVLTSKEHFKNPKSPFYHLIDKKWVLKAPQVQAVRSGPGEIIGDYQPVFDGAGGSTEVPVRLDYNADERTCILEDAKGGCEQYGYCTEYRNTWRITPGEECDERNVSCQAFKDSKGRIVSYLKNTIDYGTAPYQCNAGNNGCSWYCEEFSEAENNFACLKEADRSVAQICTNATGCACTVSGDTCTIVLGEFSCSTPSGVTCTILSSDTTKFKRFNSGILDNSNSCRSDSLGCNRFIELTKTDGSALSLTEVNAEIAKALVIDTSTGDEVGYEGLTGIQSREIPLKIPPSWMLCNQGIEDEEVIDRCRGYAVSCVKNEVGCELYTPVSGRQSDPVPAIIDTSTDVCPSECAGLETFYQEPTFFDNHLTFYTKNEDVQYFIPENEEENSCDASQAGCERFTIEEGSGEETISFIQAQACVEEGSTNIGVFYTWEGTDEKGQLRVWKLLKSTEESRNKNAPCTNGRANQARNETQCFDDKPYDIGGITDNLETKKCGPETTDPNDDPGINPNCIQFFDTKINTYWRLANHVVEESANCVPMRREVDQSFWNIVPEKSIQCTAPGCRQFKGNDSFGYRLIPLGNTSGREDFSDGDALGWRDPSTGRPFVPSRESPLIDGWSGLVQANANTWIANLASTCSDAEGCVAVNADGLTCVVEKGESKCGLISNNIRKGERYTLSLWAKNTYGNDVDLHYTLYGDNGALPITNTPIKITKGDIWKPYIYGPFKITRDPAPNETLRIKIDIPSSSTGEVHVTNIELRETSDLYIIKDGPWDIPVSCNGSVTPSPTIPPQYLGCQEYTDSDNEDTYLYQFSNVCRAEAVGCKLLVDTHNSSSIAGQTFKGDNADTGDDVEIPVDSAGYWVDDENKHCLGTEAGCSLLGQGFESRDGTIEFAKKYIKLNPDKYSRTLCYSDEIGCEAYTYANEKKTQTYFKNPRDRVCVFESATVRYCDISGKACGDSASGRACGTGEGECARVNGNLWLKEGSKDLCEIEGNPWRPIDDSGNSLLYCNEQGAISSTCYVRGCDKRLSSCTAFRDPQDPQSCNTACPLELKDNGEPYLKKVDATGECVDCTSGAGCEPGCRTYHILKDTVDENSCASGDINPEKGCVPFYDTEGPAPFIVSECQPGCDYGDGSFVDEDCFPESIDEGGKPGCVGLVPK